MPVEILRFGVGHRRADGPPGTTGISGQVIHADARGVVSELAFARGGRIEPHSNPNTTYFIVIEGGGWVEVGDEQHRVAAGEAVVLPSGELHSAWTSHSEMRVFIVEFAGPDDSLVRGILPGRAREIGPGETRPEDRAEGSLARRPADHELHDETAGEPR
jgi:quercetin dioxygenase-like cupin family protein